MQIQPHQLDPKHLLLDPNNYRFHDIAAYKAVGNRARYSEAGVQEKAIHLLQSTESFELSSLKDSILTNGFVPLEQIVVEKFDEIDGQPQYLVIEGNRRAAAVKTLLKDFNEGTVEISPNVLLTLKQLPVIEIVGTDDERKEYQQTLMAIRHIAGIREWGPYQQAKLVVELYEGGGKTFGSVAQQIGISSREVARRYRASKALQQMEDDDEFGEFANPRLYAFFHEAVSQPKVRDWLKFSDDSYSAEDESARRDFYELLSPRSIDGDILPPKLQNNRQVRQLKDIVDKIVPLKILIDPEKSFEDAVKSAEGETVGDTTGLLEHSLGLALHALRDPSIDAWLDPTERAKVIWSELVILVDRVRKIIGDK